VDGVDRVGSDTLAGSTYIGDSGRATGAGVGAGTGAGAGTGTAGARVKEKFEGPGL
jgi:hypothetical protein